MRRLFRTAILSAAICGVTPVLRAAEPAHDAPTTAPSTAEGKAAVPVRQVVLYSSGVGYFEHFGTVSGSGSTELRFKTRQINDILKSLVLQDLDKGKVSTITYPSQDPVSKTLKSFQIDITNNPSLAELLNQLRGARVTVSAGADRVTGTVLGVERKPRPVGKGDDGKVIETAFVNLLLETGAIRQVSLEDVRDIALEDPKLREELGRALGALAQARDQDKKPVTINFQGQGERRIRIGYVVETPVWKTSYRLVLESPVKGGVRGQALGEPGPATQPATTTVPAVAATSPAGGTTRPAGMAATRPAGEGNLQGWAIVENQTDNDWTDVQLSLVSGRPISFIQDLYQPLYVPRPVVQPELYASLRPQTYEEGQEAADGPAQTFAKDEKAADGAKRQFALRSQQAPAAPAPMADAAAGAGPGWDRSREKLGALDATASVASIASAAKVGELFQYTVGSVTLPRQKSAMIPIVTDGLEVERLSIFNAAILPKNPLFGARLKNTTGKHLPQGPVTVLDGGAYAGDARIDDLPPGQERLISFGIDQQVSVLSQNTRQDSSLLTGRVVKGVLQLTRKEVTTQEYLAENKGDAIKTLVIEHARRGGPWKLVEPVKADETTDALYRFKGTLEPGAPRKLVVREELVHGEALALLPMDPGQMQVFATTTAIPQPVRDVLVKGIELKAALVDVQRKTAERQQQIAQTGQEQTRLRENMKTVSQNTDYYNRLLKKLNEQETQIEGFQKDIEAFRVEQDKRRAALEEFFAYLTIG